MSVSYLWEKCPAKEVQVHCPAKEEAELWSVPGREQTKPAVNMKGWEASTGLSFRVVCRLSGGWGSGHLPRRLTVQLLKTGHSALTVQP